MRERFLVRTFENLSGEKKILKIGRLGVELWHFAASRGGGQDPPICRIGLRKVLWVQIDKVRFVMNSHWLRAEREMSQIGRGSLNFKLAIREMNFSKKASQQIYQTWTLLCTNGTKSWPKTFLLGNFYYRTLNIC